MRPYRAQYARVGQGSPVVLADAVYPHLQGESLADVGCGSGVFGYIFRAAGHVQYTVGIDFSASAVELLRSRHVYDEVHLADSAGLPIADKSVDTALSMENVEHIYPRHVPGALAELVRIAKRQVIITTPAPWDAIHHAFLAEEIAAAAADPDLMGYDEFAMLAGYLHVGWIDPEQMRSAGFQFATNRMGAPRPNLGTMIYWGSPEQIDLTHLGLTHGIDRDGIPADDGRDDWRQSYLELVRATDALDTGRPPRSIGLLKAGSAIMEGFRELAKMGR
jgi:SAM-dependent methyltransferase